MHTSVGPNDGPCIGRHSFSIGHADFRTEVMTDATRALDQDREDVLCRVLLLHGGILLCLRIEPAKIHSTIRSRPAKRNRPRREKFVFETQWLDLCRIVSGLHVTPDEATDLSQFRIAPAG